MPIVASDIVFRLSGGAANTDPTAALGGAMSTAGGGVITTDQLNNVWDNVSGDEASAGDIEYRGIYVENAVASALTLTGAKIWISSDTTSGDDEIDIALADEGLSVAMEVIGNESTAPTGPSFTHPGSFAAGLTLGDMDQNDYFGIWLRRTVNSSAAAANANPYTLSVQGETAA